MKLTSLICALLSLSAASAAAQTPTDGQTPVALKTYKAYLVCNGHLDTQWKWDVRTMIDEVTLAADFYPTG